VRFASTLISCLLLMCSVGVTHADKRVALVIGNSAYRNAPALVNPRNDAQDIGQSLRDLGFFTIIATDLDRTGMNDALDRFSRVVGGAEIALVYYSGHGMQFSGKNFLLPVEARLESGEDVNRFRLMPVEDVFDVLQGAPGARVVILDACRNNPVEDDLKRRLASVPGANRDASLTRGFSRVAANGLIVAYATQANDVASDGTERNSPFAAALLHHLGTPDLDLRQMLFKVQDEVDRLTRGKQRPELSISLVGEYKLKPASGAPANKEVGAAPPVDAAAYASADEIVWNALKNTNDLAALNRFIAQYPGSPRLGEARMRVAALKQAEPRVALATPPSGTSDVRRFDGTWLGTIACPPVEKGNVGGYTYQFIGEVKDGIFHAQRGEVGKPDSVTYDGKIKPDGSALISTKLLTGPPATTLGHVPSGTPGGFVLTARFQESSGSGVRTDGRICNFRFVRDTAAHLEALTTVTETAEGKALKAEPAKGDITKDPNGVSRAVSASPHPAADRRTRPRARP
jgi:uncharacterized caspase-like protein